MAWPTGSTSGATGPSGTACNWTCSRAASAQEADAADGFDFRDLVESSDNDPEQMFKTIHDLIDRYIDQPCLKRLVCAS